jgi:hypothetical protein
MLQQGEPIGCGKLTGLTDVLYGTTGAGHRQVLWHLVILLFQATATLWMRLNMLLIHLMTGEAFVTVVADVGEDRVVVKRVMSDEHLLIGEPLGARSTLEGVLGGVVGEVIFPGEGFSADCAAVGAMTGV